MSEKKSSGQHGQGDNIQISQGDYVKGNKIKGDYVRGDQINTSGGAYIGGHVTNTGGVNVFGGKVGNIQYSQPGETSEDTLKRLLAQLQQEINDLPTQRRAQEVAKEDAGLAFQKLVKLLEQTRTSSHQLPAPEQVEEIKGAFEDAGKTIYDLGVGILRLPAAGSQLNRLA